MHNRVNCCETILIRIDLIRFILTSYMSVHVPFCCDMKSHWLHFFSFSPFFPFIPSFIFFPMCFLINNIVHKSRKRKGKKKKLTWPGKGGELGQYVNREIIVHSNRR